MKKKAEWEAEVADLKERLLDADQCAARALEGRDMMIKECMRLEKSPATWESMRERLTDENLALRASFLAAQRVAMEMGAERTMLRASLGELKHKNTLLRLKLKTKEIKAQKLRVVT